MREGPLSAHHTYPGRAAAHLQKSSTADIELSALAAGRAGITKPDNVPDARCVTPAWLSDPMPTWYPLPTEPRVNLVSACKHI